MQTIPESHADLLERPIIVSMATIMPDNQPQVTPIWADAVDGKIRINTVTGRQKHTNLVERPQATFLIIDPENPFRWMEIRGRVDSETTDDGIEVIDLLAKKYLDVDVYPMHNDEDTRVTYRFTPDRIVTSG